MKTMMSVDRKRIFRTSDQNASKLHTNGEAQYCAKSLWKEQVRDVEKESVVNKDTDKVEMVTKKSNKISKAQKRHLRKSNK